MPAAQDKIVYLYFIYNCIVKSMACVLMFSCIVNYIFYVTDSWHRDLRCYKHKNLLVIYLFTCKVASAGIKAFANLLLHAICN